MADVTSKNMYALLGNDPEEDSDREPEPPTKVKDKPVARSGKRDASDAPPARASGTTSATEGRGGSRGGRGGRGRGGNDAAFNDRDAGASANRRNQDYVNQTDRPYRGRGGDRGGRGRGGRGREFRDQRDDRQSHGRPNEHEKQADQSWGAPTGGAEWDDEKAGEAIAQAEVKEGLDTNVDAPVNADGEKLDETEPAEPEAKSKTWDDYLAEQAEKRLALGTSLEARKPNEGSKQDKTWADAKPLNKDEQEDSYIKGAGGKAARQRERKEKQTIDIDHRFQESSRGDRGDRGARGGRSRGEYRGDSRGRGRGRGDSSGEFRGSRGNARGGAGRGSRGGPGNTSDESAFPKLGA